MQDYNTTTTATQDDTMTMKPPSFQHQPDKRQSSSRRRSSSVLESVQEMKENQSLELEYLKDAFGRETSIRSSFGKEASNRNNGLPGNVNSTNNSNNNNSLNNVRPLDMSVQSLDDGDESAAPGSLHDNDPNDDDARAELARKETRAVRTLKIILFVLLVLSAILIATFVYMYTSRDESDEFNESFQEFSTLLIHSIQSGAQNRLEAIASLAKGFQSYAIATNSTWPFVTIPYYEEQVDVMKSLTAAYGVLLFPIVVDSQRQEWEEYSAKNVGWINASFETQRILYGETDQPFPKGNETWFDVLWGPDYINPNNPDFSPSIGSQIFRTSDPNDPDFHDPYIMENSSVYFPQWQVAPMSWYYQTTVNSNYGQWDDFYNSTVISIQTGTAVSGIAWTDGNAPGRITTMLYPIFDRFHDEERKVVAFLGADIFWQDYLKNILPENAEGIFVVIENTIGQVFTYEIFGEEVEYIGYDDFHEEEYDDMVQTTLFGEHLHPPLPDDSTYTGAPLYGGFIQYTMKIYPSKQLEDNYISNKPIYYTVLACFIFLFTSLVFILYDCLVERRQRLVMDTALQYDAIVSSLYPTSFKDRLFRNSTAQSKHLDASNVIANEDETNASVQPPEMPTSKDNPTKSSITMSVLGPLKRQSTSFDSEKAEAAPVAEPPIAELFESSTILFADIVGFTSWSSDRPPTDVFTLLETLYGQFDKCAARRHVFKVETIGDCYVAVAGVPERRQDHALIMTKFARDMLVILQEELRKLEPVLGSATLDLAMRVGLHSGPVTAGVLRGERARFQLFGDSVNTASRMESNSKRNSIHVSEATATLLENAGKGSWLVKREEKIIPKGKAAMQTFWIRPLPSNQSTEAETVVTTTCDTYVDQSDSAICRE